MNQPSQSELIVFRAVAPTDLGFIYSTWLQGLYFGNDWFRQIERKHYEATYQKVIDAILYQPDTAVEVAALKEDHDTILGYSITNKDVLHWVHVRSAWRKLGLAKRLIPSKIKRVTHLTKVGRAIKPKEWAFDPFLIGETTNG